MATDSQQNMEAVALSAAQMAARLTGSVFAHFDAPERSNLRGIRDGLKRFQAEPDMLSLASVVRGLHTAAARAEELDRQADTVADSQGATLRGMAADHRRVASVGAEFTQAVEEAGIQVDLSAVPASEPGSTE